VAEQIIDEHPLLFDEDLMIDYEDFGVENSRTLTTLRTEFAMNRQHEEYGTRLLNTGVEWVEPDEQDRDNVSGDVLCYVLYKIQRGSDTRFEEVRQRTIESDQWEQISFGEDQWPYKSKESPGIVYIPITSGEELTDAVRTLQRHFSEEYVPALMD